MSSCELADLCWIASPCWRNGPCTVPNMTLWRAAQWSTTHGHSSSSAKLSAKLGATPHITPCRLVAVMSCLFRHGSSYRVSIDCVSQNMSSGDDGLSNWRCQVFD